VGVRRVFVHVDELALRGFSPEQRDAVAEGLRAEIAEAWAAASPHERESRLADAERVDAGRVRLAADAPARAIGVAAGRRITGELVR
jgi:hypothetical protein